MKKKILFIVWKDFQRRVESIREEFQFQVVYFHFRWEESLKILKIVSYFFKTFRTLQCLYKQKPKIFIVQAPPTFVVYIAFIYSKLSSAKYIIDAHNTLLYDSFWAKLPMAGRCLKSAITVIIHNKFVAKIATQKGISHVLLMDRPPRVRYDVEFIKDIKIRNFRPKILIPCSFDVDEPIEEIRSVTLSMVDIDFVITGHKEKIARSVIRKFGYNTAFTGFLSIEEYNYQLRCADAIMALTKRDGTQPSVASEAIAFLKPLIITDFRIIRQMFPAGCVYVENTCDSIIHGIRTALTQKEELIKQMVRLRENNNKKWNSQFRQLKELISQNIDY